MRYFFVFILIANLFANNSLNIKKGYYKTGDIVLIQGCLPSNWCWTKDDNYIKKDALKILYDKTAYIVKKTTYLYDKTANIKKNKDLYSYLIKKSRKNKILKKYLKYGFVNVKLINNYYKKKKKKSYKSDFFVKKGDIVLSKNSRAKIKKLKNSLYVDQKYLKPTNYEVYKVVYKIAHTYKKADDIFKENSKLYEHIEKQTEDDKEAKIDFQQGYVKSYMIQNYQDTIGGLIILPSFGVSTMDISTNYVYKDIDKKDASNFDIGAGRYIYDNITSTLHLQQINFSVGLLKNYYVTLNYLFDTNLFLYKFGIIGGFGGIRYDDKIFKEFEEHFSLLYGAQASVFYPIDKSFDIGIKYQLIDPNKIFRIDNNSYLDYEKLQNIMLTIRYKI